MEDGKADMKDLKVLYEDNHIIVVVKPFNIPSQGDKTGDIDMLTIIKEYIKEKYNKPGDVYLGLVHRLDRPTGGVMVFARTSKAAARLSEQIRKNEFEKKYLAVVNGKIDPPNGELEDYLFKLQKSNTSYVVRPNKKDAKHALLEYNTKNYNKELDLSMVEITLKTGRHHQIRVQFASRGHSLYGDQKYGLKQNSKYGKQQLALWAYSLSFEHPTLKTKLLFEEYPDKKGIWAEF